MILNPELKEIPIYQPGKPIEDVQEELGLTNVMKLASNENPFGASKRIRERIMKELEMITIYPDGAGRNLKERIADLYHIAPEQIILGNGSDEIIQYLSRAYLNSNTEVIMATPTFPMYKTNALMEGAKVIEIPLVEGKHDLEKMAEVISEKTALIWICNPNNPTGTIISEQELISFLDFVPKDKLVILDEAYAEYVTDQTYPDSLQLLSKYPNLMILRTFSKIYGLASLRIGYGISNLKVIQDLLRIKEPFNANRFAQVSAEEAILDQEFIQYCKEQNEKNKQYFLDELQQLGFSYFPSETNFVLVNVNTDDQLVFQKLLEEGIIIRAGSKLGFPGWIRVTIGTKEQMEKVVDTLKQFA
ncbi:MAG: histidinol-phosphate transaminase [Tepidibacillus sp.]